RRSASAHPWQHGQSESDRWQRWLWDEPRGDAFAAEARRAAAAPGRASATT
ncbi:unnamed protein product, partial [Symbiodinium sp. KB8]